MTAAEEGADKVTSRHAGPATNPEGQAVRPGVHPPDPSPTHRPARHEVATDGGRRRQRLGLPSGFASLRDIISFIAGVAVITHEVWWTDQVEVAILTVGVALAGLPVVFGADEKKFPPAPPPKEP